jgi:hypothetical protein
MQGIPQLLKLPALIVFQFILIVWSYEVTSDLDVIQEPDIEIPLFQQFINSIPLLNPHRGLVTRSPISL